MAIPLSSFCHQTCIVVAKKPPADPLSSNLSLAKSWHLTLNIETAAVEFFLLLPFDDKYLHQFP